MSLLNIVLILIDVLSGCFLRLATFAGVAFVLLILHLYFSNFFVECILINMLMRVIRYAIWFTNLSAILIDFLVWVIFGEFSEWLFRFEIDLRLVFMVNQCGLLV